MLVMACLQYWLQNSNLPLPLRKSERTVLFRLWKSGIFQSTHTNRDLAARDIAGNSVFCPFMSAYNTGTFCSGRRFIV